MTDTELRQRIADLERQRRELSLDTGPCSVCGWAIGARCFVCDAKSGDQSIIAQPEED